MPPAAAQHQDDNSGVLGSLTQTVTTTNSAVAVMANDIGHMKDDLKDLAVEVKAALGTIGTVTADASASPAGRELLRSLKAVGEVQLQHEERIERNEADIKEAKDAQATFVAEMRGGLRLMKALGSVVGVLASFASVLLILHTIGAI